ncbi:MAG: hypothetical protein H0W50_01420 [Parachlamydiaceae bacterium]|nr:hypothetical protein [Parachlamydiaceae bacterium]
MITMPTTTCPPMRTECIEYLFITLKLSSDNLYQYLDILREMEDSIERREFLLDTVEY